MRIFQLYFVKERRRRCKGNSISPGVVDTGVGVPLRVNTAGRYVLGAAAFDATGGPPLSRRATQSAPWLSKGSELLRPEMANGGIFFRAPGMV